MGLLFILTTLGVGSGILQWILPLLWQLPIPQGLTWITPTSHNKPADPMRRFGFRLAMSWLVGSLCVTTFIWGISAYMGSAYLKPINLCVITLGLTWNIWIHKSNIPSYSKLTDTNWVKILWNLIKSPRSLLYGSLLAVSTWLYWHACSITNGILHIGWSVYSDYGAHLAMIRSMELGENLWPIVYPHFPGYPISIHFMFDFLSANLETLGLPLDWAINLPSTLSFWSLLVILFEISFSLFGYHWGVGLLTLYFFFFRSSWALPHWWFQTGAPSFSEKLQYLQSNTTFMGYTPKENWGLWTLNVYLNQHHLVYGLAWILMILYTLWLQFKHPINKWPALFLGSITGILSLWNTPILLGFWSIGIAAYLTLPQLRGRLWPILMASISTGILIQAIVFSEAMSNGFHPHWHWGFLSENQSFWGVLDYTCETFGLLPFVVLLAALFLPRTSQTVLGCLLVPWALAYSLQWSPDITANHKWIFLSWILVLPLTAGVIVKFLQQPSPWTRLLGLVLCLLMSITGWVDWITLDQLNRKSVEYPLNHPLEHWVKKHTPPRSIFLSIPEVIHPVLMAGRSLWLGWPYYARTLGAPVTERQEWLNRWISGQIEPNTLCEELQERGIQYVVVQDDPIQRPLLFLIPEQLNSVLKPVYDQPPYRVFEVRHAATRQ